MSDRPGRNSEGYPDPTAYQAIENASRFDYANFKTYEDLREYTMRNHAHLTTMAQADAFIREKMPKESFFQAKIIRYIKESRREAFLWKAAAGPYSRQGIPDICCILRGRFFGFEVKRPFLGEATEIQNATIRQIRAAGGIAEIVCLPRDVERIFLKEGV